MAPLYYVHLIIDTAITITQIATAVYESVLPRNAGDELPSTDAGALVSIADKLDSLIGLFAAGCAPTATADPYGLRRAAVGLLQVLLAKTISLDLQAAIQASAKVQPITVGGDVPAAVLEFIQRRLEQILTDGGVPVEAVRAALKERGHDAASTARTAREIKDEMANGEAGRLHQVMVAMARPVRLTRGKNIDPSWTPQERLMQQDEEKHLWQAYNTAAAKISPGMSIPQFVTAAEALITPLDAYFDKVFVMCEEQDVRQSRLALLRDVAALSAGIMDLSELPGF